MSTPDFPVPQPGPRPGPIGPEPGPGPGPRPLPEPVPPFRPPWTPPQGPPEWWRCQRRGPVSGRYEGANRLERLTLRVDIDPRAEDSPVLDRLSGDQWRTSRWQLPGRRPSSFMIYRESWIVESPTVAWSRCSVTITGRVHYWKGGHPTTDVEVTIPWATLRPAGPATVVFRTAGGPSSTYTCARVDGFFRDLELEVDVCESTKDEPVLPTYDTHGHSNRPADLRQRDLTVEAAFAEAGVQVTLRPDRTIIDDSSPQFATWSVAELHDAMETHYSRYDEAWPNWRMWGLLAGRFTSAGTGGIMFDAKATYGGAGRAPERQGFAVFREHAWFDDLVENPSTQAQHDSTRQSIYTWVHEAGHAFNLLHSWNKSRPDSLSWMNYAWKYDNRNGTDSFWAAFEMRFDDEELIHIRHGDRAAVIMGGDEWASGGHLESPATMAGPGGPLELIVRTRGTYLALEPVTVELRLRNLLDTGLVIDRRLSPEHGNVRLEVRRPDGSITAYSPIACQLADAELVTLAPTGVEDGTDRYSELVHVAYGAGGHLFAEPGEYRVRAVYDGPGGLVALSNAARLRVGAAHDEDTERLLYALHSDEAGLALMLGGSRSRHLEEGLAALEDVCQRGGTAAATVGSAVAIGLSRPFFELDLDPDGERGRMVQRRGADPERALSLTGPALTEIHERGDRSLNLLYHELVAVRAAAHMSNDARASAVHEYEQLHADLSHRDVRPAVLENLRITADTLDDHD